VVQACSTAPTSGTVTRTVSGRQYRLRVPAGLTGPAPLVLVLHGWGASPETTETQSGMSSYADARRTIVAYPTGSTTGDPLTGWAGSGPGWKYWEASGPDLTYLRNVVTAISTEFCVNPARVHAVGHSMGGIMAQRLACNAKDVFASVAGNSTNDVAAQWAGGPVPAPCPASPASLLLSCSANWFDPMFGPCSDSRLTWRGATRLNCGAPTAGADFFGPTESYTCGIRRLFWRRWDYLGGPLHAWPQAGIEQPQFHAELAFFFAVTPKP
jgi:polyhydroxybutyrate depolymerase